MATATLTCTMTCPDEATLTQYLQDIQQAFAALFPGKITDNDPATAFPNQVLQYIHDVTATYLIQQATQQAQTQIRQAVDQVMQAVSATAQVTTT